MLKLVFVGATGHTHLVLDELPRHPQVQWAAYAPSFQDEEMDRLHRPAREMGGPRLYDDWRAMLDAEKPDIVVVCGRFDLNGPIAMEATRRGCHIFSEKPAAQTLEQVQELRALVRDQNIHYSMMLPLRYEGPYYTAHQLVRQGIIGRPYLMFAQKSYRWGQRPRWYADRAKYGSTMTWVGIHAFDYARWVSGLDYTTVYAHHGNLVRKSRPGCQDVATVLATLSNGGSAVFSLDFLRPETAISHGDDRLRVAGSEGVLEVCDRGTRLHVIHAEGDVPDWPLEQPSTSLFGDLVTAVEGRPSTPLLSAEEAFEISEFAIQAAYAADTGMVVHLTHI